MERHSKIIVLDVLAICLFGGSWLLFTASLSPHELLLGAACILLAFILNGLAWRQLRVHLLPTFREAITIWRLPWYVLTGIWEMFLILARELTGQRAGSYFRATLFRRAAGKEGISQVILATGYTTVAPNFIVIGVSNQQLLFHQLERSSVPKMIRDLESKS